MSANLNLASQPFRNTALPWTIAGIITIASLLLLVLLIGKSSEANAKATAVERDVESERTQIKGLEHRAEEIKQALTPEQLQTLQAAQALVDRKRFSWARLFADLEAALPEKVRVKRITVRDVAARGDRTVADLELVVVSRDPADVTAMIENMDRAGVFHAELIEQNLEKERTETGTQSTLRVIYQPRSATTTAATNNNLAAAATSEVKYTETR